MSEDEGLISRGKAIADRINTEARTKRNGRHPNMLGDSVGPEESLVSPKINVDGRMLLDLIAKWFGRFIAVTDPDDLHILALWTAHTYLVKELYTTPRLQIDSVIFGSGKTTVLDHLNRVCQKPVQAASLSSPALLPRMLESSMRTILLDEVDRSLRPDRPGVEDLIGILNSGYRFGATRPVLVPDKGGGWDTREMPTFAPVAMAGNSPNLPPDTVSRAIRIVLMPDLDGSVEDSDWEIIGDEVDNLRLDITDWTDSIRPQVKGMAVDLPDKCIGRSREKWRPLKRIAVAAGGRWPDIADMLIVRSIAEDEAERDAGLKAQPPGMVLLIDVYAIWPDAEDFASTRELVQKLIIHNPDYWGTGSAYGKALTETRFGRLLTQAAKITSSRPGGGGTPRGYLRSQLVPVWHRLGIARNQPGHPGRSGQPGRDSGSADRVDRVRRVDRVDRGVPDESPRCGVCGGELTRPESVERGRCAECQLSANSTDRERIIAERIGELDRGCGE